MDDLISRQAAVDLIESIETERLKGNIELIYAPAIKGLRALPPAQPEQLGTNLAEVGTDCISRQAAIEAVQNRHMMLSKEKVLLINDLEKLPSVQPKRGKWTADNACSECGCQPWFWKDIHNYNFCPNCGADMREVTE